MDLRFYSHKPLVVHVQVCKLCRWLGRNTLVVGQLVSSTERLGQIAATYLPRKLRRFALTLFSRNVTNTKQVQII